MLTYKNISYQDFLLDALPQLIAETYGYYIEKGLFNEENILSVEDTLTYKGKTLTALLAEL